MKTLGQIKSSLATEDVLQFVVATDADNKPTEWIVGWDDTNRVRYVMHKDIATKVKANPETLLAHREEVKVSKASGKNYVSVVIFQPKTENMFFMM